MSDEKKESDLNLYVYLYGKEQNKPPTIIRFKPDQWERAIIEAYMFSLWPESHGVTRIYVQDAWGIEIVRFTPRWMYDKSRK